MSATPLPTALRADLEATARAAHRAAVLHGCAVTLVAAVGGAVAAMAVDAVADLPGWVRGVALAGWVAAAGVVGWCRVLRPAAEPVRPPDLSAPADPQRAAGGLAAAAAVCLILLAPVGLVRGSGDRVLRFVAPWYVPAPPGPTYRLVVSSGDPVVRRGEPVTLTAYADRTAPGGPLPTTAVLVVREGGTETRLPMTPAPKAAFYATRAAAGDFAYCVVTGPVHSDWHTVTAADGVGVGDGSTVAIEPPDYLRAVHPPRAFSGFSDFDGPQFGKAVVALKLARPAASAHLEWKPGDGGRVPAPTPVRLAADRQSGTAEFPLVSSGTLKLVVVGERNVRTEYPAAVRVTPDRPPEFEKLIGLGSAVRDARPDDKIPIEMAVRDDVAVAGVRVEYRVGESDSPVRSEPLAVSGLGTGSAEGTAYFDLTGRAKEGDTIHLRVRATDSRAVPKQELGPQSAVFPPAGWATFRLTAAAKPLVEQDMTALRERLRDRLAAAAGPAGEAAAEAQRLAGDAGGVDVLTTEHTVRLKVVQERVAAAVGVLDELAAELRLRPDVRPLGAAVRDAADGPLRGAAAALTRVASEPKEAERARGLAAAVRQLDDARDRLDDLARRADRVALALLDARRFAALADDQRKLADKMLPAEEAARRQAEILARLREIVAASPQLRQATDVGTADNLHRLAARTRALADFQRRVDRAAAASEAVARRALLQPLADRQKDLTARAVEFAARTVIPARLADAAPVATAPFEAALSRLVSGHPLEAITEQEKAARELDRLADAFAAAAAPRADEKEAAKQLARWMTDLRQRVAADPDANRRKAAAAELKALRDTLARFRFPAEGSAFHPNRADARDALSKAVDALAEDAPARQLKAAEDALTRFAEVLPTRELRTRETRSALDLLRKEQESVMREVDEIYRSAEKGNPDAPAVRAQLAKKAAAAAEREDDIAKKLEALDAPGTEHRRAATAAAARRAAADLKDGLLSDFVVSLLETRRQFERFRAAVDGNIPVDDRAVELATAQRHLADAASQLPAAPADEDWKPLRTAQRDVARGLDFYAAPEAQEHVNAARLAAYAAEQAVGRKDVDEYAKKARLAADALTRLADRLTLAESDLDRVSRLARDRSEAAALAKAVGRVPVPGETAAAVQKVKCDAEDLDHTRTGLAQAARRKAVDAMARLKKFSNPERENIVQAEAADALKALADEMRKNADRSAAFPLPPKLGPVPDADGTRLPTLADAEHARTMAKHLRALRDDVSKAAVEIGKRVAPAEADPLAEMAREQAALAAAIDAKRNPQASAAAARAADEFRAGGVAAGIGFGRVAVEDLRTPDLVAQQAALLKRVADVAGEPGVVTARQAAALSEIAAEAKGLADDLDRAAAALVIGKATPDPAADNLAAARDAVRKARDELLRRHRDPEAAARARGLAVEAFVSAAREAAVAAPSGPGPGTDPAVQAAADAARRAEGCMKDAAAKSGEAAVQLMRQAAARLDDAAARLGETGNPSRLRTRSCPPCRPVPATPGPSSAGPPPGTTRRSP